jgi:uncharacterized integral membrane protein
MVEPSKKQTRIMYLGIIGFVLMIIVFVIIRETIQKGKKLLFGTPYEYPLAILVLILLGLSLYFLWKKSA